MQSGFTCHTCRTHLRRAINGRSLTVASRSPPRRKWTSAVKHDAQRPPNPQSCITRQQRRTVASGAEGSIILRPDDLFHPWSKSPIPDIRRRAGLMKSNALCPHPGHHQTHLPTALYTLRTKTPHVQSTLPPAHVKFECPDCGIPVYCCEDHWLDDYENHIEICDTLRQANEDDHDIRSGRLFPEFEYPWPVMEEALVNMTNWDTYLYTKQYEALNEDRSLRHATKLLTYPITIGSIIHELSPYNIKRGGRLTTEGLKSFTGK